MAINRLTLEPDGLVVGSNQLVTSGGGVSVGQNLVVQGNNYVQRSQTISGNLTVGANLTVSGAVTSTRINPRTLSMTPVTGNVSPAADLYDQVNYLLGGTVNFLNPIGTPVDGQKLTIRMTAANTRTIGSWSSSSGGYRTIGATLPTSITGSKTIYVGCVWNSVDLFWDVIAVATQA